MQTKGQDRYSRQIQFGGLGAGGQANLSRSHCAIVGCGALGCTQAMLLARSGVGTLTLIDRDFVEESNLQRQILFDERDAAQGLPKAEAAKRRLAKISSATAIHAFVTDLNPENIRELLAGASLILDATDNFETRYLINDYAIQSSTPWIYGAAVGSYGIAMPILPHRSACLRCIYPDPPAGAQPTCETAGVLNTVTTLVASLQTSDALKILSGNEAEVRLKIATADLWNGGLRELDQPPRDPACPACGAHNFIYLEGRKRAPVSLCGRNAVQIHERSNAMDLGDLTIRLRRLGEVRSNEFALRFFPEPYEMTIFADGRAIIKGTTDEAVARSLYSRYVGN